MDHRYIELILFRRASYHHMNPADCRHVTWALQLSKRIPGHTFSYAWLCIKTVQTIISTTAVIINLKRVASLSPWCPQFQHSLKLMGIASARPPSAVSLYLVFMSRAVSVSYTHLRA